MDLKPWHNKMFEVLCIIDDICTREGIRYFLDSGTAIGAVREHDFIPWDDDVDIKVLREDYPAFCDAMKRCLPEHYKLIMPEDYSPGFFDFVPRIIDDRIPLRPETAEDTYYHNYQNRLGVDIFIFDRAPNSPVAQQILLLCSKIIYGMAMSKRYQLTMDSYSHIQKLQIQILSLLGKPFRQQTLCHLWSAISQLWKGTNSNWRFPSNFPLEEQRFFPEKIYEGTAFLPFHGRKFPLPSGYDEELTRLYGDYMKPPADISAYRTHITLDVEEQ